jgi:hypothetical protein
MLPGEADLFQDFSQMVSEIFLDTSFAVGDDSFLVDKDIRLDQRTEGLRYLISFVIGNGKCYIVILYEVAYPPFNAEVYAYKFDAASKLLI